MKVNVQRMVGLGGLEPPTSPLSVVNSMSINIIKYGFSRYSVLNYVLFTVLNTKCKGLIINKFNTPFTLN